MKWWTSAATQARFGEVEADGPSARYPAANLEAFSNLPWPIVIIKPFQSNSSM